MLLRSGSFTSHLEKEGKNLEARAERPARREAKGRQRKAKQGFDIKVKKPSEW